jgi:hypothetical protein
VIRHDVPTHAISTRWRIVSAPMRRFTPEYSNSSDTRTDTTKWSAKLTALMPSWRAAAVRLSAAAVIVRDAAKPAIRKELLECHGGNIHERMPGSTS